MMTGLYATIAIQAALASRQVTGLGQLVDVNLFDVLISALANQAQNYLLSGRVPRCAGNFHPNIVPQGVMKTSDGKLVVLAGNDGQFRSLCRALGRPELADDPDFADNPARIRNFAQLNAILADVFASRTTAEWSKALEAANVPFGPINDMAAVFADPHVRSRGMQFEMEHSVCGPIPQVGSPMRFSETPVSYDLPPPTLGEHSVEILSGRLGLSEECIRTLKLSGVI
jgi:crotonobetainyl-CoA:carnitine CoA-transferase CaiB-like acyl-CoA transferase